MLIILNLNLAFPLANCIIIVSLLLITELQEFGMQQQQEQPRPSRTITIDLELWERIQEELSKLRLENLMLMNSLKRVQSKNPQTRIRHSFTQSSMKNMPVSDLVRDKRHQFKQQMIEWFNLFSKKYTLNFQKSSPIELGKPLEKIEQQKEEGEKIKQPESEKSHQADKKVSQTCIQQKRKGSISKSVEKQKQLMLIQSICLFGPSEAEISANIKDRKMQVQNSLLYASSKQDYTKFNIYGQYFYSDGLVSVRSIRQQQAPTQINQIIFRKNVKKEDCSLLLFRGDQNNNQLKVDNPILSKINPGKWLTAFFVQFSDFDILNIQQQQEMQEDKNNKSFDSSIKEEAQVRIENRNGQESDRVQPLKKKMTHYMKGKYTLCIFTYFPIINVMEHLLSSILDEVKIRRFQKFGTTNEMKDVTIKFLIKELSQACTQILNQIALVPCIPRDEQVKLTFGNFQLVFEMSQQKLDDLFFSGWAYDVLKIFEKDTIFQLFTNMMTEQSLCFVCENMHMLTYVIFFFVCILTYPFSYPHPCISNVFNFELLESPFVVVAGINQSTKWMEQNMMNYSKKIFVDLNDEAKVKGRKKPKIIKSQKLKKIFNNFYKRVESSNSPVPQIFKKKQTIIRPATKDQNQLTIVFVKSLQQFFAEQIFNHLPNPAIITFIRDKIDEKNETSKIFNILKEIQKYLKESRKQKEKDQFVDVLVQQQIFYVYMGARYGLD